MLLMGVNLACTTSREHIVYYADCLREFTPQALDALAEATQSPVFDSWELEQVLESYKAVLPEKTGKPDVQILEAIHAAAYHNNTLGLPLYPSEISIKNFNTQSLHQYFKPLYVPQRMVVSGVGIDHAELVNLARERFKGAKGEALKTEKARYTGGEIRVTADSELSHVALAFEGPSWNSKDFIAACVLQMMMGGGGSFSAGGPGKGMCTRLYTNVLVNPWVESANCFTSLFSDSALFGIHGSCIPEKAGELADVFGEELVKMTKVEADELARAKQQLKTSLQMQFETRNVQVEDNGRQLLSYGKVNSPEQLCQLVEAVTVGEVQRVATAMLKTRPSLATYGDASHSRSYQTLAKRFN
jgi:processing peptidase subunit alpha